MYNSEHFEAATPASTLFRPNLDTADGCPMCQGWGAVILPPAATIQPCPVCQDEVLLMPEPRRSYRFAGHITGADRHRLAGRLRARYEDGATIWELSLLCQRSHTFVHTLLREAGTILRPSGPRPRNHGTT
ncbi:helix-turn-helix domain-containing protein [Kitasatospora sp. KL5]|uniref:helix-turn-helix domain-containing protein n=1 Tax=Kitasatospora sp. KL5 TaxID=3425125 RepID=UPI003D6F3E5F